jgi:hypothetical protein
LRSEGGPLLFAPPIFDIADIDGNRRGDQDFFYPLENEIEPFSSDLSSDDKNVAHKIFNCLLKPRPHLEFQFHIKCFVNEADRPGMAISTEEICHFHLSFVFSYYHSNIHPGYIHND